MPSPVRLGTRGSALAMAQANIVRDFLWGLGQEVELVKVATSGDERPLAGPPPGPGGDGCGPPATGSDAGPGGGRRAPPSPAPDAGPRGGRRDPPSPARDADKSRFVKELEEALLAGEVDLAVHSAKDVPSELPPGLVIAGVPGRADAWDALVTHDGGTLESMEPGAAVGTASLRRRSQLLAARPDLEVLPLRGNVNTRLRRLMEGELDAVVLAAAGLARLGVMRGVTIPAEQMTPAPGQGALALEARADHHHASALAARLTHPDALAALTAERALVKGLGASCHTPVGAHARIEDGALRLDAFAGLPDGSAWIRDSLDGGMDEPAALGAAAAARLLAAGAAQLLAEAERWAG